MVSSLQYKGPSDSLSPDTIGRKAGGTRLGLPVNDFAATWRRIYAQRHTRLVKIACMGDSVTTGGGATAVWWRFVFQLQKLLNDRFAWKTMNQADNWGLGRYYLRTPYAPGWTVSGTTTVVAEGSGGASLSIATSATVKLEVSDVKTFLWAYKTGVGSHPIQVQIQTGTIAAPGSNVLAPTTQAVNTGLPQYTRQESGFEVPTQGPHVITFSRPAANTGNSILDWVNVVQANANMGVQVMDWGYSGYHSGSFAGAGATAASARLAITNSSSTPNMLIIFLGANDYIGNINPATTFKTQMQAIITEHRALNASWAAKPILMVGYFARWDATSPTYPWSGYVTAMKEIVAANTRMDFIDLSGFFPASQVADDADFDLIDSSGVHPTDAGHALIAQALADKLTAPYIFP